MSKIHQLDPHVADLIAAGEVVERPASAVKELTENAIDAGADSITVEIQRGGMSYIRVTDNGSGIEAEDCLTAFLRHATSKIRTEYDLEAIGTLGFRGEALAAIASVSRIELMTRTKGASAGMALLLDGGVVRTREEVGCPVGTTMIVRDLFFNTPARQKFLKRDSAEGSAVTAVVQHAALSHPEVSFRYIREGKEELHTPGDGSLKSAVYAVLGRDLALGFVPCKGSSEEIAVEGFVSQPVCCRGSRGSQFFFVNGRYVKSRTMQAALEQAYQNRRMVGRFPGCVLHLTTKLSGVDVNVHPTKTEVKFANEKKLFDAVYYAVKATLDAQMDAPKAVLEPEKKPVKLPSHDTVTPNQTFLRGAVRSGTEGTLRSTATADYSTAAPRRKLEEEPLGRTAERATPPKEDKPPLVIHQQRAASKAPAPRNSMAYVQTIAESAPPAAPVQKKTAESRSDGEVAHQQSAPTVEKTVPQPEEPKPVEEKSTEPTPDTPAWRMAGEVLNTYIIVEQGDEVWLIDKHAAHERMNFDRLKAMHHKPMSQVLLTPLILDFAPEEYAALLSGLELLKEFGFEAEDFGGSSLIVRQAPDYLPADQIEPALSEIAEKLVTTGTADPDAARDELLHTMACKSAIKGGWNSGREELLAVCEAVMSGQVHYCPHGRPVAIKMTKKDLEKQFKRA